MKYYYPLTVSFSLKLDLKEQPLLWYFKIRNIYAFKVTTKKSASIYTCKCKRTKDRAHEIGA